MPEMYECDVICCVYSTFYMNEDEDRKFLTDIYPPLSCWVADFVMRLVHHGTFYWNSCLTLSLFWLSQSLLKEAGDGFDKHVNVSFALFREMQVGRLKWRPALLWRPPSKIIQVISGRVLLWVFFNTGLVGQSYSRFPVRKAHSPLEISE